MTKEIQAIYYQIRKEIITLKREPGSFLKEVDIARKYNVSRTPIREILSRLEWDKLIDSDRIKGTRVSKINLEEIMDIMYVRSQLEISILNEIIDVITPGDLVKFNMITSDQREMLNNRSLSRKETVDKFLELEDLFIKMFYRKAAKESIFAEIDERQITYRRFLYLIFSSYFNVMVDVCRYSEDIVASLRQRDRKKVAEICRNQKYIGLDKIRMIKISHPNYFN
ncbi:MAG: GntR family transcriptional regulator [Bacilli bacterium]